MERTEPLKVYGLTEYHKQFLYNYAQMALGSRSRTKAILHMINQQMLAGSSERQRPELATATDGHDPMQLPAQLKDKKRIQISLRDIDYENLLTVANSTDTSINNYIIRLIMNDIYNEKIRLLGSEIEQLKKSNYELHKIGTNINQIARALNSDEKISFELSSFSELIKDHIEVVKMLLSKNVSRY